MSRRTSQALQAHNEMTKRFRSVKEESLWIDRDAHLLNQPQAERVHLQRLGQVSMNTRDELAGFDPLRMRTVSGRTDFAVFLDELTESSCLGPEGCRVLSVSMQHKNL